MITALRRSLASRMDAWAHALTGVGTSIGKGNLQFAPSANEYLDLTTIEALYNFDGLAARIVNAVPRHALRQGFSVATGDSESETVLHRTMETLRLAERARLTWTWARLFGGGGLFLGVDDGRDVSEPIDETNLRAIRWVIDVDRRNLYPQTWVMDPKSPAFGSPETYMLTRQGGTASQTIRVHASRIVRFEGLEPTRLRRLSLQGWGDSVLQRAYSELQGMRGGFAAASQLLQEASQGVLKLKGLAAMMASDTDDAVKTRMEWMDMSRSVARALLLDADGESFERVDVGVLSGVADVMDRFTTMLAAVSEIPVTVLMGQSPAGLNATGESDIRSWYDAIAAEREAMLRPKLERVVRLILRSQEGPTLGVEPEGWKVQFPSLWQPSPKEQADQRKTVADTDVAYITAGVLTPEEVAISRFRKEGWSPETTVDLDARHAALDADVAAGKLPAPPAGVAGALPSPDARGGDHAAGVGDVVARVASREIPRDAGVAQLTTSMGLTPEEAEGAMGEAGKSFFTKSAPEDGAAMESLTGEHAKLKASHASLKATLKRVLAKNKVGELVVGSPVGAGGSAGDVSDEDLEAVVNEAEKAEAAATP